MNSVFLALLLTTVVLSSSSKSSNMLEGEPSPKRDAWPFSPVAILIEHAPWIKPTEGDMPKVMLFADGTLLRSSDTDPDSMTVSKLTKQERERLLPLLKSGAAFSARDHYRLVQTTDQPTTELVLIDGTKRKSISIYGYTLGTAAREATAAEFPMEIQRIIKLLLEMSPRNSVAWEPRYVEAMVEPFPYSLGTPLPWPQSWPVPGSARAIRRDQSYSLILPGRELRNLIAFEQRLGEKQAVLIGGKPWSLTHRVVIPGSSIAMQLP